MFFAAGTVGSLLQIATRIPTHILARLSHRSEKSPPRRPSCVARRRAGVLDRNAFPPGGPSWHTRVFLDVDFFATSRPIRPEPRWIQYRAAGVRLISALAMETNLEWMQRVYLKMEEKTVSEEERFELA